MSGDRFRLLAGGDRLSAYEWTPPRTQRYAVGASKAYLAQHGRPSHPKDLLSHRCFRGKFSSGGPLAWDFERKGEAIKVESRARSSSASATPWILPSTR